MTAGISIVIPTVGRPSLDELLSRLRTQIAAAPVPVEVILADDRDERRGPAAARNKGWHQARYPWIAFLDDDVLPPADWLARLVTDLRQPPDVGGVQGGIVVPAGDDDWAANTAGLERAVWATADMAYRRAALAEVGGFDERFPRAYREDADLAYRVTRLGYRLVLGERRTTHPVRAESPWVSLRGQRGNADDALLRRLWGPQWHDLLAAPRGRTASWPRRGAGGAGTRPSWRPVSPRSPSRRRRPGARRSRPVRPGSPVPPSSRSPGYGPLPAPRSRPSS